ncbi:sulfite exporter TauE/SafE family protein [Neisseria bacilliformis]|uniref:sulfite exporter TauE/SafE family protein n=1 Tax=Neisseria bacilliformis TaxID=267212 RepID=UPI00066508F6|nr:sulfite exporter TauE/SafE family protein [Neisseria bacilliformis]
MWTFETVAVMLAAGSLAGVVAGMFGVGGGTILVPLVLWVLQIQGVEGFAYAQHTAVGTSFAVMVFTSFSSALSQHRKGAVDWRILKSMIPGVLLGVAAGALVSRHLPNKGLQVFFALFAAVIAVRSLAGIKPVPSRQLPGRGGLFSAGSLFGLLSSWIGIGGGSLTVPFLTFCNVPVHRAIGTSAALGWPIALAGALGYWYAGIGAAGLPAGSAGFVYLPAVAVLAAATLLSAPLGVRLSHRLPAARLKQGFGILLLLIALRMAWKIVAG